MKKSTTKVVRMTRIGNGLNPARERQIRIEQAMSDLSKTERGRAVLDDLALVFDGNAKQLDSNGMSALVCLVREFAFGNQENFLRARTDHADELLKKTLGGQKVNLPPPPSCCGRPMQLRQVFLCGKCDRRTFVRTSDDNLIGLFNCDVQLWANSREHYSRLGHNLRVVEGHVFVGNGCDSCVARFKDDQHAFEVLREAGYRSATGLMNIFQP